MENIKKTMDALSPQAQWKWFIDNYKTFPPFQLMLDNDSSEIWFNDDENANFMIYFKEDVGNRSGLYHLFSALGIWAAGV